MSFQEQNQNFGINDVLLTRYKKVLTNNNNKKIFFSVRRTLLWPPNKLFFLQASHKIQNDMFSIICCCVTCLLDFPRRRGR